MIYSAIVGDDVEAYVRARSPSDEEVYRAFGVTAARGEGLWAVSDSPRGLSTRTSWALLAHLAIVGSPERCMTGYDIIAAIEARFRAMRYRDGEDWKVRLYASIEGLNDIDELLARQR